MGRLDDSGGALERLREEKDQEIAILQEGMDATIQQLSEAQQVCETNMGFGRYWVSMFFLQTQGLSDQAVNAQIDTLILDNRKKLNQIIGTLRRL